MSRYQVCFPDPNDPTQKVCFYLPFYIDPFRKFRRPDPWPWRIEEFDRPQPIPWDLPGQLHKWAEDLMHLQHLDMMIAGINDDKLRARLQETIRGAAESIVRKNAKDASFHVEQNPLYR